MEFFSGAKAVRLQSHMAKYLQAADDQESVRQTRNGATPHVRWTVELVPGNPHVIRLKSCFGNYLAASDHPFVLGTAGKKVLQTHPASSSAAEWEPRKDGFYVKLRTRDGNFLRANAGAPPWRNSVTHDVPRRTATQDWVLWSVDVVDIFHDSAAPGGFISPAASFSSLSSFSSTTADSDYETRSPSISISGSGYFTGTELSGMELFQKAKAVRLRSHHDKYLFAEDDEEGVCQDRNGSVKNAKWSVEFVEHCGGLRFKSCFGKYLTASNIPFLFGMTGKKVIQSLPQQRLDSSVEWEPIREGFQVRLKTRYGQYLRANGGLPPWRNSVTHDIPHRTATQDWVLWDVDVVEIRPLPLPSSSSPLLPPPPPPTVNNRHHHSNSHSHSTPHHHEPRRSSSSPPSPEGRSPKKAEGRTIHYHVAANEKGDVREGEEEVRLVFKGSQVEELKEKLKEETGLKNILVCSRNPLNGKLYPLRLHLPPNNAHIHLVVVPSSQPQDAETPESP